MRVGNKSKEDSKANQRFCEVLTKENIATHVQPGRGRGKKPGSVTWKTCTP